MTGFRAWIRSKISRSPSPSPRAASPGRPARPKDRPRLLPDPQNRSGISDPLRSEHATSASAPSVQPLSSSSQENISIPVVSPVPDQELSSAHPVATLPKTRSDPRTSDTPAVDPSQSTTHAAPSWSKLRNTVDTALRVAQSAA